MQNILVHLSSNVIKWMIKVKSASWIVDLKVPKNFGYAALTGIFLYSLCLLKKMLLCWWKAQL